MPKLSPLDQAILDEVRKVKADPKIQNKDIMEWSTGEVKPREGEELVVCPEMGVNVALKIKKKKGAN